MSGSWNDFNDAKQNSNIIPKGTLAKVRLTIRPGGFDDPSQGWTGGYATRGSTGAVYLNGEFTVTEGHYARRKIFTLIGLYSPKGPDWANMGRSLVRGMLNSARGISDKDTSPQAQAARRIAGFADLDGLEFVARIDIGSDTNGEDKNEIRGAVTPDHRDYAQLMGGVPAGAPPAPTAGVHHAPAGPRPHPRTFVIDLGVQEKLRKVRRTADDFDMSEVDGIMNRAPITEEVIRHWREKAGNRQTVVFCSTVDHARNVTDAFRAAGLPALLVHGDMPADERRATLAAYASSRVQVVVNVAVLTEGWDHPPTSCVVLLRPSSYKSTMIQMVGRGLRPVNPEEHPGVVKTDCIVLDFGCSSLTHGTLEQDVDLAGHNATGEAPTKDCPGCQAQVPLAATECPLCGHAFGSDELEGDAAALPGSLAGFLMTEIDLLERSSFAWVDLFGDDAALMANGFTAWGGVFCLDGRWHAIGGMRGERCRLLSVGERAICLAAADDWLNEHETDESAFKSKSWLNQPPTDRQLAYLPQELRQDYSLTRYHASALITFRFNRRAIRELVSQATPLVGRAA